MQVQTSNQSALQILVNGDVAEHNEKMNDTSSLNGTQSPVSPHLRILPRSPVKEHIESTNLPYRTEVQPRGAFPGVQSKQVMSLHKLNESLKI
mgnify:CR=1 FL=1